MSLNPYRIVGFVYYLIALGWLVWRTIILLQRSLDIPLKHETAVLLFVPPLAFLLVAILVLTYFPKIWIYLSFLLLIPTVVISQGFLIPDNDWGVGGSIAIFSVMYGLPLFIVSAISAFSLVRSNVAVKPSLEARAVYVICLILIFLVFSILPLYKFFEINKYRSKINLLKAHVYLAPWTEEVISGNGCSPNLNKKIKASTNLTHPEGEYRVEVKIGGNVTRPEKRIAVSMNQSTQFIIGGGHAEFKSTSSGTYPISVEVSPCFDRFDFQGIGVEVYLSDSRNFFENDLLQRNESVHSIYHAKTYSLGDFK